MRAMLVMMLVLAAPVLVGERVRAAEQTIVPLTPPAEQRVEGVGRDDAQAVAAADSEQVQPVAVQEPPSPAAKAASTVGKVMLAIVAVGVAVAASLASILLL
ncbi:MAG: hypothetical protein ACREQL_07940 [Candidatus Binatia bacterium]